MAQASKSLGWPNPLAGLRAAFDRTLQGRGSDVGQVSAPVQASQKLVDGDAGIDIHRVAQGSHGIHNILKYDQYEPERGLFLNDNSVAFCFEVMPQTGADEEMTKKLTQLFTPIPPGFGVQWVMYGSPNIEHEMQAYIDLRAEAVEAGTTKPFFLDMARRRVRHVAKTKGNTIFPASPFSIKKCRLFFSITKTGKPDDQKLLAVMSELRESMQVQLRTSGLPAWPMDAEGLIALMRELMNPADMFRYELPDPVSYDDSKPLRDQITALGQHVRVKNNEVLFGYPPEEGEEDMRIAVRAFGVRQYPTQRQLWEMVNIIGSFADEGLQYPCPFLITGSMYTLDPAETGSMAELKGVRSKQNAKSKMAEYQPGLEAEARDWDVVLAQMATGGEITQLYHSLVLFCPKKRIERAAQLALNIWRAERFSIRPVDSLHLAMFYASLPMTLTDGLRADLKTMQVLTTKTTVNAVDMAPVIGEWSGQGKPVMKLFGRRGTPAHFHFTSNKAGNYNVFVAGVSGSGKSVLMNEVLASYRGAGAKCWVIDVGRSYEPLIRACGGTYIEFTAHSPISINPWSWVGKDAEVDFKQELAMLKPMVGRMCVPNGEISDYQYALIGESIAAVWDVNGPQSNPTLIRDHLLTHRDETGAQDRVAFQLAKQMEPFTEKGEYGSYFNGPATIDLSDDMIGLELEELKNSPALLKVVLFVLTSRIGYEMYLNREREKICVIDEAWQLLGGDKETAAFIAEGFRRARKYRGTFMVGTQGIQDAWMNEAAEAAWNNSDWKILMRQDSKVLDSLLSKGLINFSPGVLRMLRSLQKVDGQYSELLLTSPVVECVLRHIPDPFTLMMSSPNADDYTAIHNLMDQGAAVVEAITQILESRGLSV